MKRPPPKAFLEELYSRYHRIERLPPDPLVLARGHEDSADGEVAGLIAASLAYGRVDQILRALNEVFRVLGPSPRKTLESVTPGGLAQRFRGFRYRFHTDRDIALFLHLVRQVLDRWGSLARLFCARDPGGEIGPALCAFTDSILSGDPRPILRTRRVPTQHPVRHLLPSPSRGGAAKRLCLFLRWMVRRDCLDPGYWHGLLDPARLVVPLDTHVARVSRELGLTSRKTTDWKAACGITEALRAYDAADPVRYDFSLFRFGMGGRR